MSYVAKSKDGENLYIWIGGKDRFTVPLEYCLDVIFGNRELAYVSVDRSIEEGGLVGRD